MKMNSTSTKKSFNVGQLIKTKESSGEALAEKMLNVELLFKFVKRGYVKQHELVKFLNHNDIEGIQETTLSPNAYGLLLGEFTFIKDNGAKEDYSVALFGESVVLVQTVFIEPAQDNE